MAKHVVGGQVFWSQPSLKVYVKQVLARNAERVIASGSDFDFLLDLFKRHPDWEIKQGAGIHGILVTPQMTSYATFINRVDGSSVDISWNYCITSNPSTPRFNLSAFYRQMIQVQVDLFRLESRGIISCQACGLIPEGPLEVDHTPPFSSLVSAFEKSGRAKLDFFEYHRERVTLSILCRTCNQIKGTTNSLEVSQIKIKAQPQP